MDDIKRELAAWREQLEEGERRLAASAEALGLKIGEPASDKEGERQREIEK